MPEKELVAEVIREKALLFMRDEIPHGIAVVVERFKERPGTDLIDIDVNIYCERESHKGMVIGKGGAMLKKLPVLPVQTAKSFWAAASICSAG